MKLKDSTEHSQVCLMTYYGACDVSIESQGGGERLCGVRIWSNRYDPNTLAKESKTGYCFEQISHENKAWKLRNRELAPTKWTISIKRLLMLRLVMDVI